MTNEKDKLVRDQPLDKWLGRPGVDFNLLTSQLREHGSVRLFATVLQGELGVCDTAWLPQKDQGGVDSLGVEGGRHRIAARGP